MAIDTNPETRKNEHTMKDEKYSRETEPFDPEKESGTDHPQDVLEYGQERVKNLMAEYERIDTELEVYVQEQEKVTESNKKVLEAPAPLSGLIGTPYTALEIKIKQLTADKKAIREQIRKWEPEVNERAEPLPPTMRGAPEKRPSA